ncbi:hypothetical protein [Pedobacter nyackensis]|uniref:hypothetical protein n=1 Tax=Pedobacter nyackensis TaxID=475255 RepID=UPI00292EF136|nr:hypothetical protein [Pedobacter nyackensis]
MEAICPKFAQGDISDCLDKTIQSTGYDAPLPDDIVLSMFFVKNQYEFCKDIYNDSIFKDNLKNIPEPGKADSVWYSKISSTVSLLAIDTLCSFRELDFVQRKMLMVFKSTKWSYCPERMSSGQYILHGKYDDKLKKISLYKTACNAEKIYGASVKETALIHKFYFISAHEFGHSIDDHAGRFLNQSKEDQSINEVRANYYGFVITQALSRLVNKMIQNNSEAYLNSVELVKNCDRAYINNTIKKWAHVEKHFVKLLNETRVSLLSRTDKISNNSPWKVLGCIEKIKEK